MIDLNERRQDIIAVATKLFEKFVNMPKDVRPDDKERTGIQVLVWEPGTRNLVMASIKEPSEAAKFFAVEKAVRSHTLDHCSSANSADPSKMKFPGSVSVKFVHPGGISRSILVASVSGLKSEEDVAISVAILAKIFGSSFVEACEHVAGELPDWYGNHDKSYFMFLFK